MKTLKYFVAIGVACLTAVLVTTGLRAEGLKHIVWQTPGTNLTSVAFNDASTSPAVIPPSANGHVRLQATFINTNTAASAVLVLKLGGLFACCSNGTPDVYVPASSTYTWNFGDGYSGPISVRSTNTALTFQYWDGGY